MELIRVMTLFILSGLILVSKELFIVAHEELIEQYLQDHPDASWNDACAATAEAAYDAYRDRLADMV